MTTATCVCGRPVTVRYTFACVHEHVHEFVICSAYVPVGGRASCAECWEMGHECPMELRRAENYENRPL